MLPSSRRTRRAHFADLKRTSRVVSGTYFSLRYTRAPQESDLSRFTVVVSSSVAKTAVSRNRLKRRVRAVLGKVHKNLRNGFISAFFAKKGAEKEGFDLISAEIQTLLVQARLLHQ